MNARDPNSSATMNVWSASTLALANLLLPVPLVNADESLPSSRSALRFATFFVEFTVNGGWPLATFKPSAVAPVAELALVSCRSRWLLLVGQVESAVTVVGPVAELPWSSSRLGFTASAVPVIENPRARIATAIAREGTRKRSLDMAASLWQVSRDPTTRSKNRQAPGFVDPTSPVGHSPSCHPPGADQDRVRDTVSEATWMPCARSPAPRRRPRRPLHSLEEGVV